jgi:hypothetical protein
MIRGDTPIFVASHIGGNIGHRSTVYGMEGVIGRRRRCASTDLSGAALWVGWAASEVPFVLVLFRRPPAKPDVILS